MKLTRPASDPRMPFGLRAGLRQMQRRPLAYIAACWAVGAIAGYTGGAPWWAYLAPFAFFGALTAWRRRLAALCAAVVFLAACVTGFCGVRPEPMDRRECAVGGIVCAEPKPGDEYLLLTLDDVTLDGAAYPHRLRLYLFPNDTELPAVRYGDFVWAEAAVSSPRGVTGDGDYDTAGYLWRSGVGLTGSAGAADFGFTEGAPSPMRSVMQLRGSIGLMLDRLYPEHGALARALLLGDKSMMTDEEYAAFTDAGIVHLLAVSGLHVSVLAEALRLLLRKLFRFSRKAAYWTVLPLLALYAALTGFPASILRAIICFALLDAAPLLSRNGDKLTGLSVAFLLLCCIKPLSLFDAGFQLSFSAMLGLCLIAPVLASALTPAAMLRTPLRRALWAPMLTVCTSLSASIGTLPAAANLFGTLTFWSLAANILAIPLTSALMPALLLSLLWDGAAIPTNWGLIALERIALWFGSLPETLQIPLPRMAWGFLAVYALIVLICCAQTPIERMKKRAAMRLKAIGICSLAAVTALSSAWAQAPVLGEDGLSVTFIDVDQGDSALINAQGLCYMIDTGNNSSAANRLTSRSIRLEALFLTHPDDDHAGYAADVIEAGRAKVVYLPECWDKLTVSEEIAKALEGAQVQYLCAGDVVPLADAITATVLHPPKGYQPEEDNAASLVLLIEYGRGSVLMMGDLADAEIDFRVPDCDILKLSHHGSATASGEFLLRAASPCAAIISAGANNGYGHPAQEVVERLDLLNIPAYSTAAHGDITAQILPGGGASVETWMESGS